MTLNDVIRAVRKSQRFSQGKWEAAIATDDSNKGFPAMADECDECYDHAIEVLTDAYEGYISAARMQLENAKRLETLAGDSEDAQNALSALDALDDDGE